MTRSHARPRPLRRCSIDDVDLAHRDDGTPTTGRSAPPLLFVHGSWDDHRTWDGVVARLASEHRTVAYDRRGHGASTDVAGQGTIGGDVDDAASLVRTLGLDRPVVVGHSYGACIAIVLAIRHPDLVGGLVLDEPPVFGLLDGPDAPLAEDARAHMARAAELIRAGDVEHGVIEFVEHVSYGAGSWTTTFDECERATALRHVDTWLDQSRDPDRLAVDVGALADLDHPVTLVVGDATLPTFAAVIRHMSALLPRAQVVRIPGATHAAPRTHPDALAAAVRSHVAAR